MARRDAGDILAAVETLRERIGLSRHELSVRLGIPYNTFRKWYQERGAKSPSDAYLSRLAGFVQKDGHEETRQGKTWADIQAWWRTQHKYPSIEALAEEVGWTVQGLRACLEGDAVPPRLAAEKVAQLLRWELPVAARLEEAKRRCDRLKSVLTILADELAWFRDGQLQEQIGRASCRERV